MYCEDSCLLEGKLASVSSLSAEAKWSLGTATEGLLITHGTSAEQLRVFSVARDLTKQLKLFFKP